MTDELKPVRCGCGGEAKVDWALQPDGVYMAGVFCANCGTKTIPFWAREKDQAIDYAVTTWNKAIGADKVDELIEHIWRDKLDTREKIANLVERMLR